MGSDDGRSCRVKMKATSASPVMSMRLRCVVGRSLQSWIMVLFCQKEETQVKDRNV